MNRQFAWRRLAGPRQMGFAFWERLERHERWFKRLIVLSTILFVGLVIRIMPWERYFADALKSSASPVKRKAVVGDGRDKIEKALQEKRLSGIENTRSQAVRAFARAAPPVQSLLRYAGLDPDHVLCRWANLDETLLLSSTVFENDDKRRFYRLKPLTRSIWLTNVPHEPASPVFWLVPDGPGLNDLVRGARAQVLESSRQTTNSWGLRGPEPDTGATLRGIVMGDSYMQGVFLGDQDTPPEYLKRYLEHRLYTSVSILNAGLMGYAPEQFYYSLIALAERFKPHFAVVSVSMSDFGENDEVAKNRHSEWDESKYWLNKIIYHCQVLHIQLLIVPVPLARHFTMKREAAAYPGLITNTLEMDSLNYLDVTEDFADAFLNSLIRSSKSGPPVAGCPFFTEPPLAERFSAEGAQLWAKSVGDRLILLLGKSDSQSELRPALSEISK